MFTHIGESNVTDVIAARLLSVARYIGLVVFGLLPLIFIPYSATPLGYTKIVVATVGVLGALVFFAFSVLRQGSVRVRLELPLLALWVAFGIATLSALFSGDFFDSFWGTELSAHSAAFVGIMALVATVFMAIGLHKQTVVRLYLLLGASGVALALLHLARIVFGVDALSFGVFQSSIVATPFSEWNSLAVFFGLVIILSLIGLEQLTLRGAGRALFAGAVGLSLVMLAIINFQAVFVVVGLTSLVVIVYALTKGKLRPASSQIFVPRTAASTLSIMVALATLLTSIVFVVGGSTVGAMVSRATGVSYIEVRPSLKATVGIAKEVYREDALLGVGPNRFVDAWRLHRDPSINATIFWNTNFQAGFGYLPTILVTHGVLGGIIWAIFLGSFLYVGMRTLVRAVHADMMWYFIALTSFVSSVYLWGMSLIYIPGPVLLLLAALTTGIFFAARAALFPEGMRTVALMQDQRAVFLTIAGTVLTVVLSVGTLYYMGRYYVATTLYAEGVTKVAQGDAAAINRVVSAFDISRDDTFARYVALHEQGVLQGKVVTAIQSNTMTESGWEEIQQYIVNGVQSAKTATEIDSTEPENWAALGRVYATVVPLNIDQAYELAKDSLEKARALDPQNPARLVSLAELELLKRNISGSREYVMRAIGLKANYTDAMYILTQVEIADGNVEGAIESTRATTRLDPNNAVRFFQLGVLQYSAQHVADAQASFERAIALAPDYSNARYFLAFVYDAQGRKEDARTELEAVLAHNPDSVEVQQLLTNLSQAQTLQPQTQTPSQPFEEAREGTATDEPVTSGTAPDSPLLSPVNTDTVSPTN